MTSFVSKWNTECWLFNKGVIWNLVPKSFFKLFVEFPSPACFCFECYSSADLKFREGKFLKRIQREEGLGITPGQRAFFVNVLLASILKLLPLFPNMYKMHPSLYMYLLFWKFGASRWHHGTKVITNCYWTVNLEAALSRQETLTVEKSPWSARINCLKLECS